MRQQESSLTQQQKIKASLDAECLHLRKLLDESIFSPFFTPDNSEHSRNCRSSSRRVTRGVE